VFRACARAGGWQHEVKDRACVQRFFDREEFITMFNVGNSASHSGRMLLQDPPIARFLFQSTAASWLWLAVRLFVGYQFLTSGWGKLSGGKWLDGSGTSVLTYWQNAVNIPETGKPLITYDWYRGFLQFMIDTNSAPWFSYVIVFGELAVGLGLILGAFVGLAATGGLLLNGAFLLAGTTNTNPVLAVLGILLILAWKNAGYLGLDRYLLPALGTPWSQPNLKTPASAPPLPAVAPIR
jgi:thiosulfate dehydrogenase [quinone] large subunit